MIAERLARHEETLSLVGEAVARNAADLGAQVMQQSQVLGGTRADIATLANAISDVGQLVCQNAADLGAQSVLQSQALAEVRTGLGALATAISQVGQLASENAADLGAQSVLQSKVLAEARTELGALATAISQAGQLASQNAADLGAQSVLQSQVLAEARTDLGALATAISHVGQLGSQNAAHLSAQLSTALSSLGRPSATIDSAEPDRPARPLNWRPLKRSHSDEREPGPGSGELAHSFTLPRWEPSRFQVEADGELLRQLTDDMEQRAGGQRPADWWKLPGEYVWGSMDRMLNPWCGTVGQLPLSDLAKVASTAGDPDLVPATMQLVRGLDYLSLFEGIELEDLAAANWRVLDLFTAADFLLLSAFCELPRTNARVLEIGGGFGRIPEFLSLAGYAGLRYVNIDAVPVSLMYCYRYLSERFPDKKVVLFSPDGLGSEDADFLIVPAWHAQAALQGEFDVSINIESFQEMDQELVANYISLIDRCTALNGYIYMTNSREYKFRGTWEFPADWECVVRHRTPRSWTGDHPTEIFRKRRGNFSGVHQIRQLFYAEEVARWTKR